MNSPAEIREMTPEQLRQESTWPPRWRVFAVTMWSGFLGATLALLALLMGWEPLQRQAESPGFGVLGAIFLIGWLVCGITALVALSLAREPSPRIGAED